MRFRPRSCVAVGLITGLVLAACGTGDASGLMVVMRTDMTFPERVHFVGLYVSHVQDGRSTTVLAKELETAPKGDGTRTVALPADLAIESNGKDDSTVRVRVVAFDEFRVPITMRESRTRVPNDRIAALPLPMLWMNTENDLVANQDPDPFVAYQSKVCPPGLLPNDNGDCGPIDVDVATLAEYRALPPVVPTEPGSCTNDCFDVSSCFKPEFAEDIDDNYRAARAAIGWFDEAAGKCGVALGVRGQMARDIPGQREKLSKNLAIAVRVAPEDGAYCTKQDPSECYIVLDAKADMTVEDKDTPQGPRFWAVLPTGVCRKWKEQKIIGNRAVAVPGCVRKAADQPMCGAEQVGCSTDEGWNGVRNPRGRGGNGGGGDPDGGGSVPDPVVCRVPGASAIWADRRDVIVLTTSGDVVRLGPALAQCAAAPRNPTGVGPAPWYRFAGAHDTAMTRTLAYMSGVGGAGTLSVGRADVAVAPFVAPPDSGHFGASQYLETSLFVGGRDTSLAGKLTVAREATPFEHVSNGVFYQSKYRFFAQAKGTLAAWTYELTPAGATQGFEAIGGPDAWPLHVAPLAGKLVVLTRTDAGAPGLISYAVDAAGSPSVTASLETSPQGVDEPPLVSVASDTNLSGTDSALFFGDDAGRIFRVLPTEGNSLVAAGPTVVWRGSEPVHGLHYVPIEDKVPTDVRGILYFVTWPDGKPELARVQRVALDSAGGVIPDPDLAPGPVPGSGSSSGGSGSSGGSSGTGNTSSSGNSTSGGTNTSGGSTSGGSSGKSPFETIDPKDPFGL